VTWPWIRRHCRLSTAYRPKPQPSDEITKE
jgi:hypothetical protein